MKKNRVNLNKLLMSLWGIAAATIILFVNPSCAVIAGGSRYYARVVVEDHPNAVIKHNGLTIGYGDATTKIRRKDANNLTFTISEPGYPTIEKKYTKRVFRGWSFVGTLVTWTGLTVNGGPWLPIPFGVLVDGPTGAWWKPDIREAGITKTDYKNYNYSIVYLANDSLSIPNNKVEAISSIADTDAPRLILQKK